MPPESAQGNGGPSTVRTLGSLPFSSRLVAVACGALAIALVGSGPAVAAPTGITSDEFNSPVLDSAAWTFVDPVGDSQLTMSGQQAVISVPAGVNHDIWTGMNRGPRLVQAAPNQDFEVEVKLDSSVAEQYEIQGIVVEQDAQNLLRFEVHHDGAGTRLFAAALQNGAGQTRHHSTVPGGAPVYLRVLRAGDTWTLRHSQDGTTWTAGATFAHALNVTRIGPFASNSGAFPPSFAASVDHFRLVVPDTAPPQISGAQVDPGRIGAQVTWSTDEPATSAVAYGPDSTYGRLVSASALVSSHSVALPGLTCDTTYHFQVRSSDEFGQESRSADGTFRTAACPSGLTSDEFDGPGLDTSLWSLVDPVGDAAVTVSGGRASLSVPGGVNHDLWSGANRAPRLLQATPDVDFDVEVKFDAAPQQRYQLQGLVAAQDIDDLVRVDVYSDGATTRLFAAKMVAGTATSVHQSSVPTGAPVYLGLRRLGDTWTVRYSRDGADWTSATTFTHALDLSAVGPFAGNGGAPPPAFSAVVDHFRVASADETPPVISGIGTTTTPIAATVTWTTDEPASSTVAYGTTSAYGSTQARTRLTRNHSVTLSGLTCGTTYHFQARSRDGLDNEARSPDGTFQTDACPSALTSDEFDSPELDRELWTFVDPVGDGSLVVGGGRAAIAVPAGTSHDIWSGADHAPRLLQAAPDEDFEVEVKLDSPVQSRYQLQGIVVQGAGSDVLRIDVHHDGDGTRLFAAAIVNGGASVKHRSTVAAGAPAYLRVKRTGDVWRLRHSLDGDDWTAAATFTQALNVTAIGPFAGNAGQPAPAFSTPVDYFRAIPPDITAPVLSPVTAAPGTITATVEWTTDEPAISEVAYGTTTGYGQIASRAELTRSHSLVLRGLACGRTYHFQARSKDEAGNETRAQDATLTTGACPAAIVSDDFGGASIDPGVWTFVDPIGDSQLTIADGKAGIALPGGSSHDIWAAANQAPRLLQAAPDEDFEVEVKFDSPVERQYQLQGLLVEQDANDLLRIDVHHDGAGTRLFIASFVDGASSVVHKSTVADGAPVYLRLMRSGDRWTVWRSEDGADWAVATAFTRAMEVTAVGPFAGNPGGTAFATAIDHFRVIPPDTTPPVITGISAAAETYSARVSWRTDELATSAVEYGPTTGYEAPPASSSALAYEHAHILRGLACGTTYHYRLRSADAAGNDGVTGDGTFTTAACPASGAPVIDVWSGARQSFGHAGTPQTWVNIRGDVTDPDGIGSFDYSLNGGPREPITTSTSNPRLAAEGDFNIELDKAQLLPGQNTLELIAQDAGGRESRMTVTIENVIGIAPLPYDADWSAVGSIADVAQIVDGDWMIESGKLRTRAPGYDRMVALGESAWTDYEVTLPVTIHSLDDAAPHAGVGIALGWQGHTGSQRPRLEWPLGGMCFYYRGSVGSPYRLWMVEWPSPHFVAHDGRENRLEAGAEYQWKFRSVRLAGDPNTARYSCKVWRGGTAEPTDWDLSVNLPARAGSVALVADHADVSFGGVSVRPIGP
jgi:regulation of enolase protein 1 (concanavalin A-like superfamily)